jgi:hypothetical protein
MRKSHPQILEHQRDPVALLLERELGNLARQIGVEAHLGPNGDGDPEVRFGDVVARGETHDIALLRLASALLEKDRFKRELVLALGTQLNAELAGHGRMDVGRWPGTHPAAA